MGTECVLGPKARKAESADAYIHIIYIFLSAQYLESAHGICCASASEWQSERLLLLIILMSYFVLVLWRFSIAHSLCVLFISVAQTFVFYSSKAFNLDLMRDQRAG